MLLGGLCPVINLIWARISRGRALRASVLRLDMEIQISKGNIEYH
jgi:hypothetical protein